MQPGSLVVVSLHSPNERLVGRLIEIGSSGVTMRGLDLNAFDDWINDISNEEESGVRPSTIFFPLYRVEKIMLDEDRGRIPSLANTFLTKLGVSIDNHLE